MLKWVNFINSKGGNNGNSSQAVLLPDSDLNKAILLSAYNQMNLQGE